MTEQVYIRLSQAPTYGLSPRTLRRLVSKGLVEASRPTGSVIVVSVASLEAYLAARPVATVVTPAPSLPRVRSRSARSVVATLPRSSGAA